MKHILFLSLFCMFSGAVSAMPFDRELEMLVRGERNFGFMRSRIVQEYEKELASYGSAAYDRKMIGFLREILDGVCYPVGCSTTSSYYWNALVDVVNGNSDNSESELQKFYRTIELILDYRGIRLSLSSPLRDIQNRDLSRDITSGGLHSFHTGDNILISTKTLRKFKDLEKDEVTINREKIAKKLLANVLIIRLAICLPTHAEISFWRARNNRSPAVHDKFYSFEQALNDSLFKTRYKIRTGFFSDRIAIELDQWLYDNFVTLYEKLPISRNARIVTDNSLEDSISYVGFPNEFAASAIKLGKVMLESLNPHASYRKRKPFIVTYGLNSDHIRDYLTQGLGWIVHEVSMPNDLNDIDEGSILGQLCPWDKITNFENVSDIKLNRGWLLDTFIEDRGGKGTFLNNVLLIKNAERFLDKDYVSAYGYIGDTLTTFIKDIVAEGPTSIEIPYLKTSISTERLIVIMASGKKNITPGHRTMDIGALRPSLELRQESKVRSAPPSQPKAEEPLPILETEISEDTCKQMMKDALAAQNKVLDDKDFNLRWGALHAILSGKSKIRKLDFCCSEAFEFIGQTKNFLDGSVPPKVVNALIAEFVRKKVKASE